MISKSAGAPALGKLRAPAPGRLPVIHEIPVHLLESRFGGCLKCKKVGKQSMI
jgi:hypothetical protein